MTMITDYADPCAVLPRIREAYYALLEGTGVGAGTYRSVTVDTYGRITSGSNPTTLAGYGITDAQPLDATLTALAGLATVTDRLIYATGADALRPASLTLLPTHRPATRN